MQILSVSRKFESALEPGRQFDAEWTIGPLPI